MKKLFTILTAFFLTATLWAQSPEKMSYQAVIRDASDNLVTNTSVGMQISILQGDVFGASVYVETQSATTNANGLLSVEIGSENASVLKGDFASIDWANNIYFIKTETDPTGGTNYTITGASQLLSVPYALYAKTAENVDNIIVDYADVTNTPDLSNFDQDVTDDFDGDYNNLSNTPDLSGFLTSEIDGDVTNEIQDLQLVGNILTITNNGTATDIDLSAYLDNTDTQLSDAEIATMGYIKNADETDPSVPSGTQTGEMQYWDGSEWVTVAPGTIGQVLTFVSGIPTWKTTESNTDVTNPTTGQIWMDRNLGASQVATSSTDADAYGDLYQWGRGTDGHEKRTSGTTSTLATSDTPGHGDFITNISSPYDWRNPQNNNLWQGVSGTNNPCPSGYRLPTKAEWEAERTSWSSNNSAGAFASPLKLPLAGNRVYSSGSIGNVGSHGYYWSSTVVGTTSLLLSFYSNLAYMPSYYRAYGFSVRCLKD